MFHKYLLDIFDDFKNNYVKNNKFNLSTQNNFHLNDYLKEKLISPYQDKNIQADIISNYKNQSNLNYNDINVNILTKSNKIDKELMQKIIDRVSCMKKVVKNNKPINLHLFPTNHQKFLPAKKGQILDESNVNSGSSFVFPPEEERNGDIYIWRKEEILKVLLHELLHSFGCDYFAQDKLLDKCIVDKFNIDDYVNTNECYTETLATILNCLFVTLENDKNYEYFIVTILNEINHAKYQMDKILIHYGYKNFDQLLRNKNGVNKIFKQKTSVFSYYILKYLLLNNFMEFAKFVHKNKYYYPRKNMHDRHQSFINLLNDSLHKFRFSNNNNSDLNFIRNKKSALKDRKINMTIS